MQAAGCVSYAPTPTRLECRASVVTPGSPPLIGVPRCFRWGLIPAERRSFAPDGTARSNLALAPPLKGWAVFGRPWRDFLAGKIGVEEGNAAGVHASACPAQCDSLEDLPAGNPKAELQREDASDENSLTLHRSPWNHSGLVWGHAARHPLLDTHSFPWVPTARPPAGKRALPLASPTRVPPGPRLLGQPSTRAA